MQSSFLSSPFLLDPNHPWHCKLNFTQKLISPLIINRELPINSTLPSE